MQEQCHFLKCYKNGQLKLVQTTLKQNLDPVQMKFDD